MAAANIIDISEDTFEFEVVNYSAEVPVVLDLWAPWCIPCRVQSRDLAKLAHEADGTFRLARITVDGLPPQPGAPPESAAGSCGESLCGWTDCS